MKQVVQDIKHGELTLETVPPPALFPGAVRVRTCASLISAGTETYVIGMAKKGYLGKAKARPDLVRQVLDKAKKEGWVNTFKSVMARLEKPMPLGYSAAGIVEAVGEGVTGLRTGDRVAIAGAGYANHAEVNVVPKNLVARMPEGVTFEAAAYTTVASIALQGLRLGRPQLGETAVVLGLGLVGLLTVQLLKANGCRVFGIDLDADKVDFGRTLGLDEGAHPGTADAALDAFTGGRGADHVFITAATESHGPIEQAGELARRKGQVVVVGNVGMNVPRAVFFEKELDLKVSMSYGPGRYDPSYEEGGIDYPYDYVRWTEQRNMAAVLDLMAAGRLDVAALTTHRFPFDDAMAAYDLILQGDAQPIGVVLQYDPDRPQPAQVAVRPAAAHAPADVLRVGFAGAGNYAARHLLPNLKKHPQVRLATLVTATGLSAHKQAERFGFAAATTDFAAVLTDATDAVFIATRHATHAGFTAQALDAGKHVFVEKPMVVDAEGLDAVIAAYRRANATRPTGLMVGLNRRFAPLVETLRAGFDGAGPRQMIYRVNAGPIPSDHWWYRPEEGGGALVGEMCHFLDLMQYLAGAAPTHVSAHALALGHAEHADADNLAITVAFADGSVGTLAYTTLGDKAAPKERLEVFGGGRVALLDDFRTLTLTADGKTSRTKSANQDKGQARQIEATVASFRATGTAPIPFSELVAAMRMVFAAQEAVRTGAAVGVG